MPIVTFTTLDDPLGTNNTHPIGINNAGQISGWYYDSGSTAHGFLLNGSVYTPIDDTSSGQLPLQGTFGFGINGAGQIVGAYIDPNSGQHAFVDNAGVFTNFDDPFAGPPGTLAQGIDTFGNTVGYYYDSNDHVHGFLRGGHTPTIYTTLDVPSARRNDHQGPLLMTPSSLGHDCNL
jgi:hypothetical protein